jgi:HK97 family phage portal protein
MANEGTKTAIDAGMIARLVAGVKYTLTGKAPEWFGAGDPLPPVAQEAAVGRQFDYGFRQNTKVKPRADDAITFDQMRALADGYDLLRLVIETRKDQMEKLEFTIKTKGEDAIVDARCQEVLDFLRYPDGEHTWQTWLRMVIEDMLVLDAATIYPRKTLGGKMYSLEPIDGATIKRVIDDTGRTPIAPQPAYQQVFHGMNAVDYSRDELIYMPRNPRTNKIYGYSPVEQIIMTVNIAMRRQLHQLQYYTEGNVPEALIGVPPEWNPDQIQQFQDYFDSLLEGNTAARRHAKFIPAGVKMMETKAAALKDEYDEWLARIVCYAFSIEPTAFIRQQNRATAETAREQALTEGLMPLMTWTTNLMNLIIFKWFGYNDIEFSWSSEESVDPLVQAQINQIYVQNKVITPDEVREQIGLEVMTPEERDAAFPTPPAPIDPLSPEGVAARTAQPAQPADSEPAPTEKMQIHNHINVTPPDVIVDIGKTTIHVNTETAEIDRTNKG